MNDFLVEQQGAVLRVTINHPERGNGMTDDMAVELARIIDGAAKTSSVMVLRGAGDDFCIGRHRAPGAAPPRRRHRRTRSAGATSATRSSTATAHSAAPPSRSSAWCAGARSGSAARIAALCDITIAGERAQFQVPEYAHNIMPTMVMSALVDRVHRKALGYLVYSTAPSARSAHSAYGLASEVVPEAELDATVDTNLPDDPQGAAHGDRSREGLHACRARHGDRRRGRLRAQPARHDQCLDRGQDEEVAHVPHACAHQIKIKCVRPRIDAASQATVDQLS